MLVAATLSASVAGAPQRRALSRTDIADITTLVMLEDTRRFDEAALRRILKSAHPEVRRRAAQAVGRIAKPEGRALLVSARGDTDAEVAATVAFAAGQLKDPDAVGWLGALLSSPQTPDIVAREAARSLGKIRSPEARVALGTFLVGAPAGPATAPVVGEALLAIGRFMPPHDLAPVLKWTTTPDIEVRWRATWALFRLRDPLGITYLLRLAEDRSPEVRYWAVRGLAPAVVDQAKIERATASIRLIAALEDDDRRVRTEALRGLAQYDDDASFNKVLDALDSPDTWLSVSAAELIGRFKDRAATVVPRLVAAAGPGKPTSLRVTALTPLSSFAPAAAIEAAAALAREPGFVARRAAVQALPRLGAPGVARLDALVADPAMKGLLPPTNATRAPSPIRAKTEADYRRIVERWIVTDYNGGVRPRAILGTPRGEIEIELYAGDAPLGLEHFIHTVETGEIVGTEFGRVVPNFVAHQLAIRNDVTLRDEVSRLGLTRGNLSWASSGLDTGRPGYTLGNTPQPHNEGDFTALGRVIRGMNVVDRLELGDRITSARMRR